MTAHFYGQNIINVFGRQVKDFNLKWIIERGDSEHRLSRPLKTALRPTNLAHLNQGSIHPPNSKVQASALLVLCLCRVKRILNLLVNCTESREARPQVDLCPLHAAQTW